MDKMIRRRAAHFANMPPAPANMPVEIPPVSIRKSLPQMWRLLQLVWSISPLRTAIMVFGNFIVSLLPAYDLSVQAKLISYINLSFRNKVAMSGRRIGTLLLSQLLSLSLRRILEEAVSNNQQVLSGRISKVLAKDLLQTHLSLDTAALELAENQHILSEARTMTNSGYVLSFTSVFFNITNSLTDATARITTATKTISYDALPYLAFYSALPIFRLVHNKIRRHNRTLYQPGDAQRRKDDIESIVYDAKTRREVRLFNLETFLANEHTKATEKVEEQSNTDVLTSNLSRNLLTIFTPFSKTAIYAYSAYRAMNSEISLADLHLIENTVDGLFRIGERSWQVQQNSSTILSQLNSYYAALDLQPALPSSLNPLNYLSIAKGMTIEFQDVSFRYSEESPLVLDQVSFKIEAGSIAAIVGYNGSGKSTIIALLARVYDPLSGRILINGHDLKEYDRIQLNNQLAFTPQDFARWPLTGLEHVAIGKIDDREDKEKIMQAARLSGAFDVLDRHDGGKLLDGDKGTPKTLWSQRIGGKPITYRAASRGMRGNTGSNSQAQATIELSGGQWQKVALARSFLRGGDLLVLDEPSANLDPQAEFDLFSEVYKLRSSRTAIFISHRLGVVRKADTILFLDKGRVVECGTHSELMALPEGKYRHLVTIQMGGLDGEEEKS